MTTLKELKKAYPDKITTSGSNYLIEGFGRYKQVKTIFGIETYHKKNDDWSRIQFEDLENNIKKIY